MRIFISGTHGTGKSTLLNQARAEKENGNPLYKDMEIIGEIARHVSPLLPLNDNATDLSIELLANLHLANAARYENLIQDRSIIDVLVYALVQKKRRPDSISNDIIDFVWDRVLFTINSGWMDGILLVRKSFPLEGDAVRPADVDFQRQVEREFSSVMDRILSSFPVVTIWTNAYPHLRKYGISYVTAPPTIEHLTSTIKATEARV